MTCAAAAASASATVVPAGRRDQPVRQREEAHHSLFAWRAHCRLLRRPKRSVRDDARVEQTAKSAVTLTLRTLFGAFAELSRPRRCANICLPQLREALRRRGGPDRRMLGWREIDLLIAAPAPRACRSGGRGRPTWRCSTGGARTSLCTCSSTCTATRATAARRWSTWQQDLRGGRPAT